MQIFYIWMCTTIISSLREDQQIQGQAKTLFLNRAHSIFFPGSSMSKHIKVSTMPPS